MSIEGETRAQRKARERAELAAATRENALADRAKAQAIKVAEELNQVGLEVSTEDIKAAKQKVQAHPLYGLVSKAEGLKTGKSIIDAFDKLKECNSYSDYAKGQVAEGHRAMHDVLKGWPGYNQDMTKHKDAEKKNIATMADVALRAVEDFTKEQEPLKHLGEYATEYNKVAAGQADIHGLAANMFGVKLKHQAALEGLHHLTPDQQEDMIVTLGHVADFMFENAIGCLG